MGKKSDIERLFLKIREEKVTLFIGSGFSLYGGAPKAIDIEKALKSDCPVIESKGLPQVAEEYIQRHSDERTELLQILRKLIPSTAIDDTYQKILTRIPHFRTIFTTNYDSFLEDAYGSLCKIIREDKDFCQCENNVTIFKLHGDFQSPNRILITNSDYNSYFKNQTNSLMWDQLRVSMLSSTILFIGYSIDDPNVYEIIKDMETLTNKRLNEMFMVSPSTEDYKFNRLKKHNVTWIKSTGEELLPLLEKNIINNIFSDFRHKTVSERTFVEFCHIHNLNPAIKEFEKKNAVLSIAGYNGKPVQTQIKFTVENLDKRHLDFDLESDGPILDEGPLKGKYALSIPSASLKTFESRANGVLTEDLKDIKNLYLIPVPKAINTHVYVPSRGFIGTLEGKQIRTGRTKLTYIFDLDICELRLSLNFMCKDTREFKVNIHIEMHETYSRQSEALHWIELVDAIVSGEIIKMPEIIDADLFVEKSENPFIKHKQYYQFVQEIELKSGAYFKQYYNCTPDRYSQAAILVSWLRQEEAYGKITQEDQDFTITFEREEDLPQLDQLDKNQEFSLILRKSAIDIIFNDYSFHINYDYTIVDNCQLIGLEKQDNQWALKLHNKIPIVRELFSSEDKMPFVNRPNFVAIDIIG